MSLVCHVLQYVWKWIYFTALNINNLTLLGNSWQGITVAACTCKLWQLLTMANSNWQLQSVRQWQGATVFVSIMTLGFCPKETAKV